MDTSDPTTVEVARHVSAELEASSEEMVEQWIEWLKESVGTRAIRSIPVKGLRNHIPPVLRSLATYVANPLEAVRSEVIGHLRIHAQIRLDQGYSIQELLTEFEGLHGIVLVRARKALRSFEGTAPLESGGEVVGRLSTGLSAIAHAAVGLFRLSEGKEQRELSRELEEFGKALAHELRSPLNTAAVAIELLSDDTTEPDPQQRNHAVDTIAKAIKRADDLLDNVRLLALSEQAHSNQRLIRLEHVSTGALEESMRAATANGVEISVDGEIPAVEVEAIPTQIALANLLANSIKYSDPGKEDRWVRIRFEKLDEDEQALRARVTVRDNGLGIPPDFQDRVFQRHFRAHPEVAEGTGLGLSLTSRVIRGRGGTIELQSSEGEGTTVSFTVRATDATLGPTASARNEIDRILQDAAAENEPGES